MAQGLLQGADGGRSHGKSDPSYHSVCAALVASRNFLSGAATPSSRGSRGGGMRIMAPSDIFLVNESSCAILPAVCVALWFFVSLNVWVVSPNMGWVITIERNPRRW